MWWAQWWTGASKPNSHKRADMRKSVTVDFICQLGWDKGYSAGKTLFLGVSLEGILKDISIWFRLRLSKEIRPCVQASSRPLAWTWQEGKGGMNFFSSFLRLPSPPDLGHWSSKFLGLQTLGLIPATLWFSVCQPRTKWHYCQLEDGRLWDFLASISTWANGYHKSLSYTSV